MQRIACYTIAFTISMVCLVGCSSGWKFDNWRNNLSFKMPGSKSKRSTSDLVMRARQLEEIQQYDVAAEVYAEILKQDQNNRLAQQRLSAIQRLKQGLPDERSIGAVRPESTPVSERTGVRPSSRQNVPRVSPSSPERPRSIAGREQLLNRNIAASPAGTRTPGRASVSTPDWSAPAASPSSNRQPVMATARNDRKRVPLEHFATRPAHSTTAPVAAHQETARPGSINIPAIVNAAPEQQSRPSKTEAEVSQVSMTTVLPEIAQPHPATRTPESMTLLDIQKRLSTHPADPSAIELLVQGLRTEDRIGRWEISSTLGVLMQNPDAKTLIVDSLSRALSDQEPLMRRRTALVISSFGANGRDLRPVIEKRLNDEDESVREAAAFAIDEIR